MNDVWDLVTDVKCLVLDGGYWPMMTVGVRQMVCAVKVMMGDI